MHRLIQRAPFESCVLLLALVDVALSLSPSSYGLALGLLGEQVSALAGIPRRIRTEEWSVVTPLFQAVVNNDFRETNETSFYSETLRSFVGLPLLNWGLLFKPQVWAFFVLPPALAYSIYWASIAVLQLVGWSLALRECSDSAELRPGSSRCPCSSLHSSRHGRGCRNSLSIRGFCSRSCAYVRTSA
jgi:hypothetical protein